jgi:hypothetical protein
VLTARAFVRAAIMPWFVNENANQPPSSTALRTIRTGNYPQWNANRHSTGHPYPRESIDLPTSAL